MMRSRIAVLLAALFFACAGAQAQDDSKKPTPPTPSPSPSPSPSPDSGASKPGDKEKPPPVRVSQEVMDRLAVRKVEPIYPLEAKRNHISGDVILQVTIGKDGLVHNLKIVSGHPVLAAAAMDAVRQWRYRPFRINGEPLEVETTIPVQFRM